MKKRLICFAFIAATATFASFFGGAFSYALFFASISVPVTCFIYLIFVFVSLTIYQEIDSKIVVKGEKIGYKYILSNESTVYFTSIKTQFISDYSKVEFPDNTREFSLAPGQRKETKTSLVCLYRGEYKVGVKAVTISDYLGLFSLTRKYPSTLNLRVYPRVVKLNSLAALNFGDDVKSLPFTLKPGQEQDADLRSFALGDSVKSINWKISARRGELFARRRVEPPKEKIAVFIDTSPIAGDKKIPLEDRILETALAISNYYCERKIEVEIIYSTAVFNRVRIDNRASFNVFYDACLTLPFSRLDAHEFLENLTLENITMLVVITTDASGFLSALSGISRLTRTCVILTKNCEGRKLSEARQSLGKTALIHLPEDAEISSILENGAGS
jgi:uncharacterized protein (DUF58 family)